MITKEEVLHIARLSHLRLTEAEIESHRHDLGAILDYINKLNQADTQSVEPSEHPFSGMQKLREDRIEPSLPVGKVLQNAPESEAGFFLVPKVIS